MSDQKPREWWVKQVGHWPGKDEIYDAHNTSIPADAIHVIEHSAYQALAMRLKEAEEENKVLSERFVSKTEYDDLETENEKLKAEVERLKGLPYVSALEREVKSCNENLTLERKITAMLREEIGELVKDKPQVFRSQGAPGPFSPVEKKTSRLVEDLEKKYSTDLWTPWLWFNNGWRALQDEIEVILAREKEMRHETKR